MIHDVRTVRCEREIGELTSISVDIWPEHANSLVFTAVSINTILDVCNAGADAAT